MKIFSCIHTKLNELIRSDQNGQEIDLPKAIGTKLTNIITNSKNEDYVIRILDKELTTDFIEKYPLTSANFPDCTLIHLIDSNIEYYIYHNDYNKYFSYIPELNSNLKYSCKFNFIVNPALLLNGQYLNNNYNIINKGTYTVTLNYPLGKKNILGDIEEIDYQILYKGTYYNSGDQIDINSNDPIFVVHKNNKSFIMMDGLKYYELYNMNYNILAI